MKEKNFQISVRHSFPIERRELKYIGTLCVEFFIDRNDNLYVNEIAPRVHNSGHLTINSHNVSQFENHIRAICKLEKIPIKKLYDAEMINILGNNIEYFRKRKYFKSFQQ